jgi:hypothetical protein
MRIDPRVADERADAAQVSRLGDEVLKQRALVGRSFWAASIQGNTEIDNFGFYSLYIDVCYVKCCLPIPNLLHIGATRGE